MKCAKGTQDFLPYDKAVQQAIFSKLRAVAERYHFKEIETPAFEPMQALTEKEGEEIKQQIFCLEQRGSEALGLRFDMTVPAVRMFLGVQKSLPKPVNWFYLTRMWRYERPQKGRMREFYQFGVESFGSEGSLADAQVVQMAWDGLQALGLTKEDVVIRINHRGLLQDLITPHLSRDNFDEVVAVIDKKEKVAEEEFVQMLQEAGVTDIQDLCSALVEEDLEKLPVSDERKSELRSIMSLIEGPLDLHLSTVRGLAYYTGMVFEIFDVKGELRSICGGGRYDNLVSQFGGVATPATGFGMGYSTLYLLLENRGLLPKVDVGPDYYIAPLSDLCCDQAFECARVLRKKYSVALGLTARAPSKHLAYGDSVGAKKVMIVGEKDLEKGNLTIKNLESGDESVVEIEALGSL